jgi:hypothetical protein
VRTRLLALTAAVAPLAALMIGTGSPAMAAPGANCGSYPPGSAYGIRANTNGVTARVVTVKKGKTVRFTARVFRNGENCSGRLVRFYVHGPREFSNGVALYHQSGQATTNADGLAIITKTVVNNFRWYAAYASDNGTGTASSRGADRLVQAS